jgi:hypothetical protein
MTVDVARRRSKGRITPGGDQQSGMAIGEIGQTIFSCPACGRPLAIGVRKCSGCSTRLLMGVQLGRAGTFVTIGLILGVAFGGGLAAILSASRLPAHDAQVAEAAAAAALARAAEVQAAAAPVAIASPAIPRTGGSGGSTGAGTSVTMPAISSSALSQALVLDVRLSQSTADLEAAAAAPKVDVLVVAQLLRKASADSVIGLQLAQNLRVWSGGSAVADRLTTFYTELRTTADEGLGASIRDQAAYREAAHAVVKLLGGLDAVDGQARSLAAGAGIGLPAATSPAR